MVKLILKKIESKKTETNQKKINEQTPKQSNKTKNKESSTNTSPDISKKQVCKFYLQQRCIFGSRCRNFHPENKPHVNIPPFQPNFNLSQNQNRTGISPGVAQRTETYTRGRQVGYWSLPQHSIPLNQTRFSYLPEVSLNNLNDFPMLSQ